MGDVFEFDYQSVGENSTEMTSDKRKVKFTPLKPGTTVVMMSAGVGGRVESSPPELKPVSVSPPDVSSSSASASASLPTESLSPPSKRRRTIGPGFNENCATSASSSSASPSFANTGNINNNNIKIDNNNLTVKAETSATKPAPVKYSMIGANIGASLTTPDVKLNPLVPSSGASSTFSERNADASDARNGEIVKEDVEDGNGHDDDDDDVDNGNGDDPSPKDNPDIFSKFSLCHAAEMKSNHPELSTESIETKLREQWDSMSDEEANWYIFNGVPPGKLLPGKKRARPKSKFLEKLCERYSRRPNGLTA